MKVWTESVQVTKNKKGEEEEESTAVKHNGFSSTNVEDSHNWNDLLLNVLILTADDKEFDDVLEDVSVYRVFRLAAATAIIYTPASSNNINMNRRLTCAKLCILNNYDTCKWLYVLGIYIK